MISCEKEIESIGIGLVDNDNFSRNQITSEVITSHENVERVPASGLQQYLLGVYADDEFGSLEASIVGQLVLPASGESYDYGTNGAIDSVIVSIPYQATREVESYAGGQPKFSIDSVWGDTDVAFKINVYELKTFLNSLDPYDPSKNAVYYSDKDFQKGSDQLFSGDFKVNPNDTVSIIKRYLNDGITVYDRDTIKEDNLQPTIKLPLDEQLIKQLFVDNASGAEFDSNDSFIHFFRGLFIEAEALTSDKSHLISLNMVGSKMTIYYSKDQNELADQDLNDNGINGEQDVRTKHLFNFSIGALKSNILKRDYTNSKQSGNDRLYVQGAAGSIAIVELLSNENLAELQSNNWLITDANLVFYVDQNASSNIAPERLFIYNFDENLQIRDVITEGITATGGVLERDEDGNPYRYSFKITDYISELLKSDDPDDLVKIGLKVFNPTDTPTSLTDVEIIDFSWNPKGVVLFDHNASAGEKRIKLEIFYSEIN
jgi:hypothetical protein